MQHRPVCVPPFNRGTMSDDAAIRRENFKAIVAKRGWPIADLCGETGKMGWGRYSYWRDLLENPTKSFGEKIARRIEERLTLPRGSLDEPGYGRSGRYPKPAERIVAPAPTDDERFRAAAEFFAKLFPRVSFGRLSGLDPELVAKFEDGLIFTADMLHVDIRADAKRAAPPATMRRKRPPRRA